MTRRPLCLVCLLLMLFLCVLDGLGFPVIRGNPLPEVTIKWIEEHPESTVCGEVERCTKSENSLSVYLKNVSLFPDSGKDSKSVSIENVKVFLKEERENIPAGTFLYLQGSLTRVPEPRNPGEFDSRQYYACEHIYYYLEDAAILRQSRNYSKYRQFLFDLRDRLAEVLDEAADESAGVFQAMVLGDKSGLSEETQMRYQLAGIVHILAISGLHISAIGVALFHLLKRLGLGLVPSGMISLALMLQYGVMTGGSVSAMRAVCMFLIAVGAKLLGRSYDMPTALALSALLIVLESPAYLYSASFLLSYGAVLGITAVNPALLRLTGAKRGLTKSFLGSLGVQITTLPVMLYFYGEVSLAGIFLNLAVLPTVGAVLFCGVGAAVLGCFWIKGAWFLALPGRGLLLAYEWLCRVAAKLPFSTWTGGQPKAWQIAVYYGFLLTFLAAEYVDFTKIFGNIHAKTGENPVQNVEGKPFSSVLQEKKTIAGSGLKARKEGECFEKEDDKGNFWRKLEDVEKMRKYRLVKIAVCLPLLIAGTAFLAYRPRPYLKITCLDVGQGDGISVEVPGGYQFLVDGGSTSKSSLAKYQLLPYLKSQGISRLDGIFISHTDEDHVSGVMDLLEYMADDLTSLTVDGLYLPKWQTIPEKYAKLEKLANEAGVEVKYLQAGDKLLAGNLEIHVLAPETGASGEDVNEDCMILELDYGGFSALFTGDIGTGTEEELLNAGLLQPVDFLKVAHHGSRYSTGDAFLAAVQPKEALISCSSTNNYGHPSPDTVSRLTAAGADVHYTMENGAFTLTTNGRDVRCVSFLK